MSRRNRRALAFAIVAALLSGVAFVLLYAAVTDPWIQDGSAILIVTVATWFVIACVGPVRRAFR